MKQNSAVALRCIIIARRARGRRRVILYKDSRTTLVQFRDTAWNMIVLTWINMFWGWIEEKKKNCVTIYATSCPDESKIIRVSNFWVGQKLWPFTLWNSCCYVFISYKDCLVTVEREEIGRVRSVVTSDAERRWFNSETGLKNNNCFFFFLLQIVLSFSNRKWNAFMKYKYTVLASTSYVTIYYWYGIPTHVAVNCS